MKTLTTIIVRLALLFALAFWLFAAVAVLRAAPAPGPRPPPLTSPARPLTVACLHKVNILHWGGREYEIGFERTGEYWCLARGLDGSFSLWSGSWRFEGGKVILEETYSTGRRADEVPQWQAGPHDVVLELWRKPRGIVGQGWCGRVLLERR